MADLSSNVNFYIGDITKPDDVRNAISKVSLTWHLLKLLLTADICISQERRQLFTLLHPHTVSVKRFTSSSTSPVPRT